MEVFNEKHYYFIWLRTAEKVEDVQFEIGLTSTVTMIEILCCQLGPEIDSIAYYLLEHGIAFNTFLHAPAGTPPLPFKPQYPGLGYQ